MATLLAERKLVCTRGGERAQRPTPARSCAKQTQSLDLGPAHSRSDDRVKPVVARLERLLPLPAEQPRDGQAQLASARPAQAVVVAQAWPETGVVERLP